MLLPGSAVLWRIGAAVAIAVAIAGAVWWHGYTKGQAGPLRELAAVQAVAAATDARYRALEQEVADAQQKHVDAWRSARRDADAAWVRLKDASRGRVPAVCPEPGGAEADRRDGVEAARGAGDRDLLPAVVGALETGERLEATLALCQAELRQCAGLR